MGYKTNNYCEIYEISVTIEGKLYNKFYIGQSWLGAKVRFIGHKNDKVKSCPKLFNAMGKYGRENFSVRAILAVKTQEDADYFEDHFINQYDSINNGFNLKEGGSTGKMSEESKKKLSQSKMGHSVPESTRIAVSLAHKGVPLSAKHKAKISERVKGENHPLWGTHQSEESKLKNSESNKKIYLTVEEGGKGYIHPSTGKIFGPLSEDVKRKISEAHLGENNYFYGKHHTEETKIKLSEANKGKVAWNKGVSMSEERRQNLIENHPMKGRNHSEESKKKKKKKKKMSESQIGLNAVENNGMFGKGGKLNPMYGIKVVKHSDGTITKEFTYEFKFEQALNSLDTVYKIYKITNDITNESYINYTFMTIEEIFDYHKNNGETPNRKMGARKLFNSFKQYEKNNFSIECLLSTKYNKCADSLKEIFIENYNSINNGYNSKTIKGNE